MTCLDYFFLFKKKIIHQPYMLDGPHAVLSMTNQTPNLEPCQAEIWTKQTMLDMTFLDPNPCLTWLNAHDY